jgi:hypothetical protein
MRKKLSNMFIILILIISSFSIVTSSENKVSTKNVNEPQNDGIEVFMSCFIDASGEIARIDWPAIIKMPNMWKTTWFRPFKDDRAVATYWQLVFDSKSEIRIYSEENGELLWQHDGSDYPQIRIFGFYGTYIPSSSYGESLHVSIRGNVLLLWIKLR